MQQKQQDDSQKAPLGEGNIRVNKPPGKRSEEDVEIIAVEAQEEVAAASKPWYQTRKWGFILLAADAILLSLFALLATWVVYHPVSQIDIMIQH